MFTRSGNKNYSIIAMFWRKQMEVMCNFLETVLFLNDKLMWCLCFSENEKNIFAA